MAICNSENPELRSANVPFEKIVAAMKRPCPYHGYMHSLSNSSRKVIRPSDDMTAWPDMPIRHLNWIHPYCSHPSLYPTAKGEWVCSRCHDVCEPSGVGQSKASNKPSFALLP